MTETQAWAFLVLGVFSAAIALLSVVSFRRVAARRVTLDFLRRYTAAPEVARGIKILRANSPDKFIPLEGENRENLLFLLNMFESLAIGLDSGIYDKRMVIQSFRARPESRVGAGRTFHPTHPGHGKRPGRLHPI